MAITYELLEEFTGTRTYDMGEGEDHVKTDVSDIDVKFTCDETGKTYQRTVNVCFDADGKYDADATATRIGEVALSVGNKMACGVIT